MRLTNTKIKYAKVKDKDYKLSDERGLYLPVTKKGRKYWRLKYYLFSKEKKLAIGVYPDISLKQARDARDSARQLIAQNIDPFNKNARTNSNNSPTKTTSKL